MKNYGVNYDAGIDYRIPETDALPPSIEEMRHDLRVIRENLHANAVRIYGTDLRTLVEASRIALGTGLCVWLSPRLVNGSPEETVKYIESCAREAECLRSGARDVELVFVVGTEFTLDTCGLVAGATISDRARELFSLWQILIRSFHLPAPYRHEFSRLVHEAARIARQHFKGRITYSAGLWESVDWTQFDIVSVNYYRASFNERSYVSGLRKLRRTGKPVAITEFGCCTYIGADKKGPNGHNIVDRSMLPARIPDGFIRSEETQARLITELLDIYEKEDMDSAFVFDFIGRSSGHDPNPRFDLDMASYGIVAKVPRCPLTPAPEHWRPKLAFANVAAFFEALERSGPTHL